MCSFWLSLLVLCLAALVILFSSYRLGKSLAMADNVRDTEGSPVPQAMGNLRALGAAE